VRGLSLLPDMEEQRTDKRSSVAWPSSRFIVLSLAERGGSGLHSAAQDAVPERSREPLAGLLEFTAPLIAQSRTRLRGTLQHIFRTRPAAPIDQAIVEKAFSSGLLRQLLALAVRTLVLELNVARLKNLLQGDTPEERFRRESPLN